MGRVVQQHDYALEVASVTVSMKPGSFGVQIHVDAFLTTVLDTLDEAALCALIGMTFVPYHRNKED